MPYNETLLSVLTLLNMETNSATAVYISGYCIFADSADLIPKRDGSSHSPCPSYVAAGVQSGSRCWQ